MTAPDHLPASLPAYAYRAGFRAGRGYAQWAARGSDPTTRPDTTNPYTANWLDEAHNDAEDDGPTGVCLFAPAPVLDVAEVIRSRSGHVVLVLFPWLDSDLPRVLDELHDALDALVQRVPGLHDPRPRIPRRRF